jgi:hypothetical protein
MLQILQSLKDDLKAMEAKAEAGFVHTKEEFASLVARVEEAIGWHKTAQANAQFPTEPVLSAAPEGVMVEGAGIVSQAHIDAVVKAAAPEAPTA